MITLTYIPNKNVYRIEERKIEIHKNVFLNMHPSYLSYILDCEYHTAEFMQRMVMTYPQQTNFFFPLKDE